MTPVSPWRLSPLLLQVSCRCDGLRHFKIKINSNLDADHDRLRRVAATIGENAPSDFASASTVMSSSSPWRIFENHWASLAADAELTCFFERLLFIEQPLHRDIALEDSVGDGFGDWLDRPSIIIDESNATIKSLPLALGLGYAGTSHKNCKGIFKR